MNTVKKVGPGAFVNEPGSPATTPEALASAMADAIGPQSFGSLSGTVTGEEVIVAGPVGIEGLREKFRVALNAEVSNVDHPAHYGGADNPYEAIKIIEAL